MIYPIQRNQDSELVDCLRMKTGSCRACNIPVIAIGLMRWDGLPLSDAEAHIKSKYCPNGETPDIAHEINTLAYSTMGARREENLEGLVRIPRLGWQTRR